MVLETSDAVPAPLVIVVDGKLQSVPGINVGYIDGRYSYYNKLNFIFYAIQCGIFFNYN